MLSKAKISDALDGLYAYDAGCVDSGIHDELLRHDVFEQLNAMAERDLNMLLGQVTREIYLTDKALRQGYGLEDVAGFIDWLSKYIDKIVVK